MPRKQPTVDDLASAASLWRRGERESGRRVFVVHGHDDAAKLLLVRFLEKVGLEPVILQEKPGGGRTILEKFYDYADVTFAVVLLTRDDEGRPFGLQHEPRPRARQNVILELGFFLGALGRSKVCALYVDDLELPSDFEGLMHIPLDRGGGWQIRLARELKHAGLTVNLNEML